MPRPSAGYALIEALVTLAVVLVGLSGALRLQAELLLASAEAKSADEATALAISQLNVFTNISSYEAYLDQIAPGNALAQGQLHRYKLDWAVIHSDLPDYKQIVIDISWPPDAPAHSLRLHTLISAQDLPRFARQQLQP